MHSPSPTRRRRAAAGLLALAAGSLLAGVVGATPALAAVLPDAVRDVVVTPTDPAIGTQVRTEISWCVPDGTLTGDTFSLTLSEYLRNLPSSFTLTDPQDPSKVVATAVVDDGPPAVVTFTMTAYAESHTDVCGSAFLQSGFDNSLQPGVEVPFTFTDDDGTEFTTPVTPRGGGPVGDLDEAFKYGGLSSDQGHTDPNDAVRWYVVSPQGPLASVTLSDNPGGGQNIDCATAFVSQGTRTASGVAAPRTNPTIITPIECTADAVSVTVGPIPAGQAVLLGFTIDLDEATGPEAHTFQNTANVVSTTPEGSVRTDAPSASQTSSSGGGGGEGDVVPSVDIEKWSTADGYPAGDFDTAPGKTVDANMPVDVTLTITNDGQDALTDVAVGDTTDAGPAITGLTCDFSVLGGPATGTTWAGPFAVGDTFECTGTVPGLAPGEVHADTADVIGTGLESGRDVEDADAFHVTGPTPEPSVGIVKGDDRGHAADTAGDAVTLGDGTASLVFTVTNDGTEPLVDVVVSDRVVTGGTVKGLGCRFPDGTTGTTWAGPFAVGDTFDCSASLSGVAAGSSHQDIATVTGAGASSGTTVDDENPYFAKRPAAGALAMTGTEGAMTLSGLALGFLLVGASVVAIRQRRSLRRSADRS